MFGFLIVFDPAEDKLVPNASDVSYEAYSRNAYDAVKRHVGMCCYIKRDKTGGYRVEKNAHYDFACEPKLVVPADSDALGIHQDQPVYTEYLSAPSRFDYLTAPENNMDDCFAVFRSK